MKGEVYAEKEKSNKEHYGGNAGVEGGGRTT